MDKKTLTCDFCVIGGGSGGLSLAAGASQMGAEVVLIENGKMGGDCLNYGCVPSKALIQASKFNAQIKKAAKAGWKVESATNDFKAAMQYVHNAIATIAVHDSVARFTNLGVKVIEEFGYFSDRKTVETENYKINAKYFVIATGSRAGAPPINGLHDIQYLTNETIFDLQELPKNLCIIGGGPIGIEMAQAFLRLGSKVTVLEAFKCLAKDDSTLTEMLLQKLKDEGVKIYEQVKIKQVSQNGSTTKIQYELNNEQQELIADKLVIAAGRIPNIENLQLDKAGIKFSKKGIEVGKNLKSTNNRVYAIGDCAGGAQFTHVAGFHAGLVIRNSIFKLPVNKDRSIPWVTFTDPELAHVGLTIDQLKQKKIDFKTFRMPFNRIDRAITDSETFGEAVVHLDKKGKILGATILGPSAGELIYAWGLAIDKSMKIGDIAGTIAAYPTLSDISKQLAGKYFAEKIFSEKFKKITRRLLKLLS